MILLAWLAAGLVLGAAYFQTGRWTTDRLVSGRATSTAVAMIIARFAALAAALTLIGLAGAMPLLTAAVGVFIARAVILHGARVEA